LLPPSLLVSWSKAAANQSIARSCSVRVSKKRKKPGRGCGIFATEVEGDLATQSQQVPLPFAHHSKMSSKWRRKICWMDNGEEKGKEWKQKASEALRLSPRRWSGNGRTVRVAVVGLDLWNLWARVSGGCWPFGQRLIRFIGLASANDRQQVGLPPSNCFSDRWSKVPSSQTDQPFIAALRFLIASSWSLRKVEAANPPAEQLCR
jgi:hypothetical protein